MGVIWKPTSRPTTSTPKPTSKPSGGGCSSCGK